MRYLLLLPLILTGCNVDRGKCLASHTQPAWIQLIPMTNCVNNSCTTTLMPIVHPKQEVCDKWEFPEGRPKL